MCEILEAVVLCAFEWGIGDRGEEKTRSGRISQSYEGVLGGGGGSYIQSARYVDTGPLLV